MTLKVIAFTPQPPAGASSRYRVYQMTEALAREGIALEPRPFLDDAAFARLYESGRQGAKAIDLARGVVRRWSDVGVAGSFDLGLIHRELWPLAGDFLLTRLVTRQPRWAFSLEWNGSRCR